MDEYILWTVPVIGSIIGRDWLWIMPWVSGLLIVSGILSGAFFIILKSFFDGG